MRPIRTTSHASILTLTLALLACTAVHAQAAPKFSAWQALSKFAGLTGSIQVLVDGVATADLASCRVSVSRLGQVRIALPNNTWTNSGYPATFPAFLPMDRGADPALPTFTLRMPTDIFEIERCGDIGQGFIPIPSILQTQHLIVGENQVELRTDYVCPPSLDRLSFEKKSARLICKY